MADVFLSYAHEDIGTAEKLARLLTSNGLNVWWDRRLFAGDDLNVVIERALLEAKCAIVLWSPHSVTSHWVRGEAQMALDLNKLVPLQIAECNLPINFRGLHTPQIFKPDDQLSDLAKLLTEKLAATTIALSRESSRRTKATSGETATKEIVFAPESTDTFLSDYRAATRLDPSDTYSERMKKSLTLWKRYPVRMTLLFAAIVAVVIALNVAIEESTMAPELKSAIGWLTIIGAVIYFYVKWPRGR